MHIRTTRRGARILHGRHVLSEVLARPGPTHSVFDVLAACAAALSPSDELVVLGFAGGGLVAPLRALGRDDRVQGVDLELRGARLFERLARAWKGEVQVARSDAAAWLRRRRRAIGCAVEDLSIQQPDGDVQKPEVSLELLPGLLASRLARDGVAIFNLLPAPGRSWLELEGRASAPFQAARVVELEAFENRILVGARELPSARTLGRQLDALLELLGSRMCGTLRTRALRGR